MFVFQADFCFVDGCFQAVFFRFESSVAVFQTSFLGACFLRWIYFFLNLISGSLKWLDFLESLFMCDLFVCFEADIGFLVVIFQADFQVLMWIFFKPISDP